MPNSNAAPSARRPLLGLLSYSYLAAKNGLILIFSVAALLGIASLIGIMQGAGPVTVMMFSLMSLLLMAGPILSVASNSDGMSGWNRYQAAMRVSRGQIVAAKFLAIFGAIAAASIVLLAFMGATFIFDAKAFHRLAEVGQWVTNGTMVIVAPLLTASFYLPLTASHRNRGSSVALLLTCLIGAFAGSQFLFAGINRFILTGPPTNLVLIATICISGVLLLLSFLITRIVYTRRSF